MNIIMETEVHQIADSDIFAKEIASRLTTDDVILFYGDLGSGKTYLIKKIVESLGIQAQVTSPSFSIINQYGDERQIYHIDLYRIKNKTEIINTGFDEVLNSEANIFIEWPQMVEDEFTWQHYRVYIETSTTNQYWRKLSLFRVN